MGSMTIGAKYKTTLKDPGTPGVLRMVRATLPSRPVLSPSLPEAPLSLSLPSLFPLLPACAHGSRWGASSLRDAPLLRAGVLVGFWGARGELNRGLGGDLPRIGSAEVEVRSGFVLISAGKAEPPSRGAALWVTLRILEVRMRRVNQANLCFELYHWLSWRMFMYQWVVFFSFAF